LGLVSVSSFWLDALVLIKLPKKNLENSFDKLPTCTLGLFHQLYDELDSSPTPLQNTPLQLPTIP
jgi:hypothetical protein